MSAPSTASRPSVDGEFARTGTALLRGALDPTFLERARIAADRVYDRLAAVGPGYTAESVADLLPPGERYLHMVSSVSAGALDAVLGTSTAYSITGAPLVVQAVEAALGPDWIVLDDQAWLRRQYAPGRYPPAHHPHVWHQDGALGYDFLGAGGPRPDDVLPMITAWCPLTPCGVDAPGLEVITRLPDRLLAPVELADPALRRAYPPEEFLAPDMRPGDVLLIAGATLHRTHVTPDMTADRTSVEVRFLAGRERPARLAGSPGPARPG